MFSSDEFERFERHVEEACQQTEHETHVSAIEKAIPIIATELRTITGENLAYR